MENKLQDVVVYSPVNDHRIKADLTGSPIWKTCYHKEELTDEIKKKHGMMYEYHFKFDGTVPVQHTKKKQIY